MRTEPKPHQETFLRWLEDGRDPRCVPLLSEPGTGKTWMACAWLERIRARRALVFVDDVYVEGWVKEVHEHSDGMQAAALLGPYPERKEMLADPDINVFVTNYHMLSSKAGANLLKLYPWDAIIADEATNIKDTRSGRTKAAIRLSDGIPNKMISTGEPITNKLEDIWSQYRFVDGGRTFGRSFWEFRQKYFRPYGFDWILRPGAEAQIRRLLATTSFRVLKKDVMDLPAQRFFHVAVPMTPKQRSLTQQIVDDWCAELDDGTVVDFQYVVHKCAKLHQICSGRLSFGKIVQKVPTLKPVYLESLLRSTILPRHEALLVFCRYVDEVSDVEKVCSKLGLEYVSIAGSVKAMPLVERFQSDPSVRACILTLSKGSRALTLTKASATVYYGRDFSSDRRGQSLNRNHRIGSERHLGRTDIEYYDLFVKDSVEEKALRQVRSYRELAVRLVNAATVRTEFSPVSKS